jgi:hypothetical protein
MSLFDTKGEINAVDTRSALQAITKMAKIIEENQSSSAALAGKPSFNEQQKDDMIKRALLTTEGKIALGQAMALPIRRNLDYAGVARRALVVDPLPTGALPIYERDIDVAAVVVSANGSVPESIVRGDRVTVPEFDIVSNPVVKIREVRQRRFNVIERAVQKARQEIQANEDANIFAALDFAGDENFGGENTPQDLTDAGLSRRDLVELGIQVDRWDLVTTKYFMNIVEFAEIRLWTSQSGSGVAEVDPVTHREILQTGLYARIFGADIIVSKIVTPGTVFACADPEFVGIMPVRQEIEVMPADEPKRLSLGWVVSETIGLSIVNPRSCSTGRKGVSLD